MYWQVQLVADTELAADWVIVDTDGDFLVIARESSATKEPGRITTEVMRELKKLHCPARPLLWSVA